MLFSYVFSSVVFEKRIFNSYTKYIRIVNDPKVDSSTLNIKNVGRLDFDMNGRLKTRNLSVLT